MIKYLLVLISFSGLRLSLSGQCPDGVNLWNRIVYLRDSSVVPPADQLRELNGYLAAMNHCPGRNDSAHALLLLRIGWLLGVQKNFTGAIECTNRSIDMIHAHIGNPGINEAHLIKCYNNLLILYDSTGEEKLRLRAMDSCISIAVKLKTGYQFAMQHIKWEIRYFFEKGDYYHCLNYTAIGEDITRKGAYRPEEVFYYLNWKINALIFLNKYKEADEWVENSIAECRRSGNEYYLGSLLGLKAFLAEKKGDVTEAVRSSEQSLRLNKKVKNFAGCYGTLNNLGFILYFSRLHQNNKALYYYREALKYADNYDSANTMDNIANVYASGGSFDSAFYFFREAFGKIRTGIDETDLVRQSGQEILEHADAEYMVNLVLDKAATHLEKYKHTHGAADVQNAVRIYKIADQLMDKIKIAQTELSSKLFWRTDTRRLYEQAIESCFLSGNAEEAFYFFEKSRAVLLNDDLKEQGIGDADILQLATVKRKILQLERVGKGLDPASTQYSDIQRELFINKQELSRTEQLVREHNPWYYQSFLDTSFITLKQVQQRLLGDGRARALLELFNGDSAVYLLTISSGNGDVRKLSKEELGREVDQYISYISNPSLLNRDFPGFVKTAGHLYQLLFQHSPLPEGRIIFSPDGRYFPVEALITNSNVSAPDYFLNKHIVSYTYSARYLMNNFARTATVSSGDFLGVAPVQYPSSFRLASLPGSDRSVDNIGTYFSRPGALIGGRASKNNFMRQFHSYKIIQLYTHASDSSSGGEPVIYFADSSLYLSELIPENKPETRLIVLSACETGNGVLYKGEGVFSFNRGFAALGIPSSVINLWSVDDESTYKLTELFYKYVAEGLPLDISLQKAKLEFIGSASKEKELPYYWAAAIVAGKTNAIELTHNHLRIFIAILGGLAGMFFLRWIYISNSRTKRKVPSD